MPISNKGIAALDAGKPLEPWNYEIRDLEEDDVLIEVHFCGICHSDIHMVHNDWEQSTYPMVPGHEFTGVVKEVGKTVKQHKPGDRVGVGCLVGSCRSCPQCYDDLEQYCKNAVPTYSGKTLKTGEITYGGYGQLAIVPEHFVLKLPDSVDMTSAPLLCAGITTFSPCKYNGLQRGGFNVGVIGLGGLGHMAVQWAAAMGNNVFVFSRSTAKREEALKLGAFDLICQSDEEGMKKHERKLHFIIDTVCAPKPITDWIKLLDVNGKLISVGLPPISSKLEVAHFALATARRCVEGSSIGGIKETQEMLNFAGEHGIKPYIELIEGDYVNEAYKRVQKGDVKFRFVIDVRATFNKK